MKVESGVARNEATLNELFGGSGDVIVNRMKAGRHDCLLAWCDGMTSHMLCYEILFKRLYELRRNPFTSAEKLFRSFTQGDSRLYDCTVCEDWEELSDKILSGCAALMIDGVPKAICVTAQGYNTRGISESYTEENVRSSREGFVESIKVNMTLIRRRIKSDRLVFQYFKCGKLSNTDIMLVYLKDRVPKRLVRELEERLANAPVEMVLESGFVQPFLNEKKRKISLFSSSGHTERPDTLCAKLLEGRVGILVDGTPFALVVPYLFSENFQCVDDYTNKAWYSSMMRIIKITAFFIAFLLPGLYLAVANFHPRALSSGLLLNLANSQQNTPLSLLGEALLINLLYEIVREAGLRLPRPVGHAVSLIGALVIGDAAVSSGIIGNPMLVAVAFTALCSFTVPTLYQASSLLRFAFIFLGGLLGIGGIAAGFLIVMVDLCAVESYGIPYTAPFSPASKAMFRDGIFKKSWLYTAGRFRLLYDLNGAHKKDE